MFVRCHLRLNDKMFTSIHIKNMIGLKKQTDWMKLTTHLHSFCTSSSEDKNGQFFFSFKTTASSNCCFGLHRCLHTNHGVWWKLSQFQQSLISEGTAAGSHHDLPCFWYDWQGELNWTGWKKKCHCVVWCYVSGPAVISSFILQSSFLHLGQCWYVASLDKMTVFVLVKTCTPFALSVGCAVRRVVLMFGRLEHMVLMSSLFVPEEKKNVGQLHWSTKQ